METDYDFIERDGQAAAQWARELLARSDWAILDTETTGLGYADEVVSIAVLAPDGTMLLDTLVRPTIPIPPDAIRIHKITNEAVATAPTWRDVLPRVQSIFIGADRDVVIYNASYDRQILRASSKAAGVNEIAVRRWLCAMEMYAQWCGDWSDYHGSYRWQKLTGGDHTALGDCRATLATLRRMAATPEISPDTGKISQ